MGSLEEEELARLRERARLLEHELESRLKQRESSKRNIDDVVVEEIFEELERSLKDPTTAWDSDEEDEGEGEGTAAADASKANLDEKDKVRLDIIRFTRQLANSLASATILVRNDFETRQETVPVGTIMNPLDERPKEVLVEIPPGMTFRGVLELVCEYFGLHPDAKVRLVDERGIWHHLNQPVLESIRTSRRRYPALYLQQSKGLDDVIRKCDSNTLDADFETNLVTTPVAPLVRTLDPNSRGDDMGLTDRMETDNGGLHASRRNQDFSASLFELDPILFTWRRAAFDFLLTLALFIVLSVFLGVGPRYTEASGLTILVESSLVQVSFTNPANNQTRQSVRESETWDDFWAWAHGPLTNFLNQQYMADQQTILFGPVQLRQNRVRLEQCPRVNSEANTCFPGYSPNNELTDAEWAKTKFYFQKNDVESIAGVLADYPSRGYVVDVFPRSNTSSSACQVSLPACSSPPPVSLNITSCWECVLRDIQNAGWLDEGSRLVTVKFDIYSANADMFVDAIIAFEYGSSRLMEVTYEVRYGAQQSRQSGDKEAFVVIVGLLAAVIGCQIILTGLYLRSIILSALRMDLNATGEYGVSAEPRFWFKIWWSLPSRFTVWNPILFSLCVSGLYYINKSVDLPNLLEATGPEMPLASLQSLADQRVGQVILSVANMAATVKLASYFRFSACFFRYFANLFENMFMLCVAMSITLCSFAWLLSASTTTFSPSSSPTFGDSFVWVVRILLNQLPPSEIIPPAQQAWFPISWVFYTSQIVLNLILVRIAAPICYHALKDEQGPADYFIRALRDVDRGARQLAF